MLPEGIHSLPPADRRYPAHHRYRTVDTIGNVNAGWSTIREDSTVAGCHSAAECHGLINGTVSSDLDHVGLDRSHGHGFSRVIVSLDGVWKTNVTKASGLYDVSRADHQYPAHQVPGRLTRPDVDASGSPYREDSTVTGYHSAAECHRAVNSRLSSDLDHVGLDGSRGRGFRKVMVYLDGVWKINVSKGVQRTPLRANPRFPAHHQSTRTVDTTGNVNAALGRPFREDSTRYRIPQHRGGLRAGDQCIIFRPRSRSRPIHRRGLTDLIQTSSTDRIMIPHSRSDGALGT